VAQKTGGWGSPTRLWSHAEARAPRASHASGARLRIGARGRVSGNPRGEAPRMTSELEPDLQHYRAVVVGAQTGLTAILHRTRRGAEPGVFRQEPVRIERTVRQVLRVGQ